MLTARANIHRYPLPPPGALVRVEGLQNHGFSPRDRWQVEAFPLCDNVRPYSLGIHTVHLRRLRDGRRAHIAGHWCTTELNETRRRHELHRDLFPRR